MFRYFSVFAKQWLKDSLVSITSSATLVQNPAVHFQSTGGIEPTYLGSSSDARDHLTMNHWMKYFSKFRFIPRNDRRTSGHGFDSSTTHFHLNKKKRFCYTQEKLPLTFPCRSDRTPPPLRRVCVFLFGRGGIISRPPQFSKWRSQNPF